MTVAAALAATALTIAAAGPRAIRLAVPAIAQAPERCGPVALEMVLRFYDAPDSALARARAAYDPILHGTLITDLARAAEASGYAARVARVDADSLRAALHAGTPPIVLYEVGIGPLVKQHFGAVIGWDGARERFVVNDGHAKPREMKASAFESRWSRAGSLALFVQKRP